VNDIPHCVDIGIGTARSERHHGAFLEGVESKMFGDKGVDHADAVEKPAVPASLDLVAFAYENACCRIVAITVHDQNSCLLEWGDEVDGRMRFMVSNVNNLRQPMSDEMTTETATKEVIYCNKGCVVSGIGTRSNEVEARRSMSNNGLEKCPTEPSHIPRGRDEINVFQQSLAILTKLSKSAPRESTRMLLPVEAFLLKHDDWPTVPEQRHPSVMALAGDTEDFHAVAVAAQQNNLSTAPPHGFFIAGTG
jgi:hypothetical protein